MFRRLLVAFDGSSHARRALTEAIELAQANRGTLTVVTVAPEPSVWAFSGYGAPVSVDRFAEEAERTYQAMLDDAVRAVPADLPVTKILRRGPAAREIVAVAKAGNYDLIVAGSRGHGELRSLLRGSVSHHIVQASHLPVLVIHASSEDLETATAHDDGAGRTSASLPSMQASSSR